MWAGGKTRMIKRYTASGLLPESSPLYNTSIDTYIEPFFGGGAMFLHINKILKPSANQQLALHNVNMLLTEFRGGLPPKFWKENTIKKKKS